MVRLSPPPKFLERAKARGESQGVWERRCSPSAPRWSPSLLRVQRIGLKSQTGLGWSQAVVWRGEYKVLAAAAGGARLGMDPTEMMWNATPSRSWIAEEPPRERAWSKSQLESPKGLGYFRIS